MRIDNIYKVVITAANRQQIADAKDLSQKERKLILRCCNALPTLNYLDKDFGQDTAKKTAFQKNLAKENKALKLLIKKLEAEQNPNAQGRNLCTIIGLIFKKIAEILHLRIASSYLHKKLIATQDKAFIHDRFSITYNDMISRLMNMHIKQEKRYHVLKTIESFYLLHVHNPNNNLYVSKAEIREKTGLIVLDGDRVELAPELLLDKYEKAKESNNLHNFFEEAFNPNDKGFKACYKRIKQFNNKENENVKYGPEDPKKPDTPPNVVNIDDIKGNVDLIDKLHHHLNDKEATIFNIYQEKFLDIQINNFLANNRQLSKQQILIHPHFYDNYANNENFEKYLIKENIIGKQCSDGVITRDNLPELINNLVRMEMLGIKPPVVPPRFKPDQEPEIDNKPINPQPINPQPVNNPKPQIIELNQPIDLKNHPYPELIAKCKEKAKLVFLEEVRYLNIRTNADQIVYNKMLKDLKVAEDAVEFWNQSAKEFVKNFHQFEKINEIMAQMQEVPKILLNVKPLTKEEQDLYDQMLQDLKAHKKDLLKYRTSKETIKGFNQCGQNIIKVIEDVCKNNNVINCRWINKLLLHGEYPIHETLPRVINGPRILLKAYQKSKEQGLLLNLFNVALKNYNCFENRLQDIQYFMENNNMLEDVDIKELLKPPFIPNVSKKVSHKKNMDAILEFFIDMQARKYYKDTKKMDIDLEWLKPLHKDHPKYKITEEDDFFQEHYNNKANFIKFLIDEVKIIGEKASDEFTAKELDKYAQLLAETPIKLIEEEYLNNNFIKNPGKEIDLIKNHSIKIERNAEDTDESYEDRLNEEKEIRIQKRQEVLMKNAMDKHKTKQENILQLLQYFIEYQALDYAWRNDILIDNNWLTPQGDRKKILDNEDFKKEYYTKENFKKFLQKYALGKQTSDEFVFTKEILEDYAESFKQAYLLENYEQKEDDDPLDSVSGLFKDPTNGNKE